MIKDDLPLVSPKTYMQDVIVTMTESRLGLAIVVEDNQLLGVITDGDLRRGLVSGFDIKTSFAQDLFSICKNNQ